jgi:hypothetical protein
MKKDVPCEEIRRPIEPSHLSRPKTCPVCGGSPAFTAQPNYEGFCDEHIPPLPVLTEEERDAMSKRFFARQHAEREADRQHAIDVWLEAKHRRAREKAREVQP